MAKSIETSENLQIDNMQNQINFSIEGKVALITGAASGLGLCFAKDLLQQGIRGLTMVDINSSLGETVCNELKQKYGEERVIFVKVDTVNKDEFEDAFKETVTAFGAIDILINNAGILNDRQYEKEIAINVTGTTNGILLGLEHYIQRYKSGSEGVIVNVCSISALGGPMAFPMATYSCSKFAVYGLTITFGCPEHFRRTDVRVVAICPGITDTPLATNMLKNLDDVSFGKPYRDLLYTYIKKHTIQRPESCSSALMQIIKKAPTGTLWVSEGDERAYQYEIPDRFNIPKVYLE